MTREEAKDYIREWCPYDRQEEIIKALEQEPCEDAISQKIDEFKLKGKTAEIWIVKGKLQIRYLGIIHNIPLSPVTPKQRTGYWLPYAENNGVTVKWVCSSCRRVKSVTNDRTEYCPVCGAKMEGESE